MISVLSLLNTLSGRFVSLAYTCVNSFVFLCVVFAKDLSLRVLIENLLLWVPGSLEG